MAMRDCCSFDGMVTADLDERYSFLDGIVGTIATGRNGNGYRTTSGFQTLSKLSLTSHATYGLAFAYKPVSVGAIHPICEFLDGVTTQCGLAVDATGKVFVYRSSTSTVIATSASIVIVAGAQHHIQFQVTVNNTTGVYEVRVDGVNVLSGSGVNLRATANNQANGFQLLANSGDCTYDDLYCWDGSGSINNTFPGDVRVFAILPSGAGNSTQMTPSAGSNYQCVDDASPNTSNYVSESTVTEKDTYAFADISGTGTVLGAQLSIYAQKSAAGPTRAIKGICRSSSTEALSSEVTLGQSWRYWVQASFENDPATSAAWASVSALNGAEFGQQLTT